MKAALGAIALAFRFAHGFADSKLGNASKPVTKPTSKWTRRAQGFADLTRGPIARASILSLLIRVMGLGLAFLQAILTARLLGPSGYGTIATILSAAQVIAIISIFGLGPMAVRQIPTLQATGEAARLSGYLRRSLAIAFVLSSLLSGAAAYAVIPALTDSPTLADRFAVGGILVIPFALLALLSGWARGFGRAANSQLPREILRPLIMVSVMSAAAFGGLAFNVLDYLTFALGAAFLALAITFILLWRSDLSKLKGPSKPPHMGRLTKDALPFLGLGLAAVLQGELNTLMLAVLAGPNETGLFQPVARIAPLFVLPVQAATVRFAPRIAEFWAAGERSRIAQVSGTFTWTTSLLTLALVLILAGFGPWLMLAFGPDFVSSAPLLWIVALAQLFNASCGPVGTILTMCGEERGAMVGMLTGLLANFVAGLSFIPTLGAMGAAIALAIGIVVWNLTMMAIAWNKLRVTTHILSALKKSPAE